MKTPRILLTVGASTNAQPYERAITAAGGHPLTVTADDPRPNFETDVDGIVIAGGASVEPKHYHSEIDEGVVPTLDPPRDELEFEVLDAARNWNIPVFGICRGLQVINVFHGGSLHQELGNTTYRNHHQQDAPRDEMTHTVRACRGVLLELEGHDDFSVNSMHRQGVKRLGEGLNVTGLSDDGLIEAVETDDRRVFAVQWHPEELVNEESSTTLFRHLISRSVKQR